jgi:hypothetical protein
LDSLSCQLLHAKPTNRVLSARFGAITISLQMPDYSQATKARLNDERHQSERRR